VCRYYISLSLRHGRIRAVPVKNAYKVAKNNNTASKIMLHLSPVTATYLFFDWILPKREWSIYQNVRYFIKSKTDVLILSQLYTLCTSAVKWHGAKNNNSPLTYHLVSLITEFLDTKNFPLNSLDLRLVNFLLWSTLQQKLYRQEIRDLIFWSAFCRTARSHMRGRNKRGPRTTVKRAVMYTVVTLNSR